MSPTPTSLDRVLAGVGTVLAWLPIAATLATGIAGTIVARSLRVDFLMPAELFFVYAVGAASLGVAALRTRRRLGRLASWVVTALVGLVAAQGVAVFTGLASGDEPAAGWRLALVLAMLALYTVAVVMTGVEGVRLVRELRRGAP